MNNELGKPIVVARQEFIDGMIEYINRAGLPSFLVAGVMEEILMAVKANINKEYDAAYADYMQALQAEKVLLEEQKAKQAEEELKKQKELEKLKKGKEDGKKGG